LADCIAIDDLHKQYGDGPVLHGLSMRVEQGEVYGLLGPNGVGKTTLLHLLLGFIRPDRGRIRLFEEAASPALRARIGYLPERMRYHLRYTPREYLRFMGGFARMSPVRIRERSDYLLDMVGLSDNADRMIGSFSKSMLQRLGIAQALLAEPGLLLLDEPTTGLEPEEQHEIVALLGTLRDSGRTILLSTHYFSEIEQLCDRVGILFGGAIATQVPLAQIRGPGMSVNILVSAMSEETCRRVAALSEAVQCSGQMVTLRPNTPQLQARVMRMLLDAGCAIIAVEPVESPLELIYARAVRGDTLDDLLPPVRSPYARPLPPVTPPAGMSGDTLLNDLLGQRDEPEK
jgi:ABC-2 type transport system ATP-binding protein